MKKQLNSKNRTMALLSGEDTNVGKSTFARLVRQLLIEMFGACQYLLVEKIGRDIPEGEDHRYRPEEMRAIQLALAMCRAKKSGSVIVDVGGGQNQVFMAALKEAKGSDARIDLFVLPVTEKVKIDKFIETIEELLVMGVEPSKLAVVLNRIPIGKTFSEVMSEAAFVPLAKHAKEYGYRIISVPLPENEAVAKLRNKVGLTIGALAGNTADFNEEFVRLVELGQDKEAEEVFELEYLSEVAKSMQIQLEACFNELFSSEIVDVDLDNLCV